MRPIFRRFCKIRFGIGPLHYISSRSDFDFEFAEKFVIKNDDSPTRRVGESVTECLKENSPTHRVRESASRGVAESESRRVGESLSKYSTIGKNILRSLCVPVVADISCRSYSIV
jgi:hypothetical protein